MVPYVQTSFIFYKNNYTEILKIPEPDKYRTTKIILPNHQFHTPLHISAQRNEIHIKSILSLSLSLCVCVCVCVYIYIERERERERERCITDSGFCGLPARQLRIMASFLQQTQ
jgi:hypothetical protein